MPSSTAADGEEILCSPNPWVSPLCIYRHRILVFRDQGIIFGDRHVEISRWFGPLESTFYKHPASPHPDVFRVSNDPEVGCTGVGRTGWHVDGSFQRAPFSHSLYHIISVPKQGATVFVPLYELIHALPEEQRARWDRLSMCSDRRGGHVKPLIYTHPRSGLDTLCFHLGMTAAFIWDYGTAEARLTGSAETEEILNEMEDVFTRLAAEKGLIYKHQWMPGDFIISDNAAVGHEADAETQASVEKVGLRVMHRTTIQGSEPPSKKYEIDAQGRRIG